LGQILTIGILQATPIVTLGKLIQKLRPDLKNVRDPKNNHCFDISIIFLIVYDKIQIRKKVGPWRKI